MGTALVSYISKLVGLTSIDMVGVGAKYLNSLSAGGGGKTVKEVN